LAGLGRLGQVLTGKRICRTLSKYIYINTLRHFFCAAACVDSGAHPT
jgi:hypothetical protein